MRAIIYYINKEEVAALTGSILALKILTDTKTRAIFEEYR